MSISLIKANFTGGEVTPAIWSRSELDKYSISCKTMRNVTPLVHGSAQNRAGTQFIVSTKDSSKKSRLIRFQFSVVQWYQMEFGEYYIRFVKDDGQIVSSKSITGAANNGSGLIRITSNAHGFTVGQVTISGVGGVPAANGTWTISNVTTNTFDLVGSTFSGTYTSGGTAVWIVEVETPYEEADLFKIKYEQTADIIRLWHPSYDESKLSRSSHTSWTFETVSFGASVDSPTNVVGSGGADDYAVTALNEAGNESAPSAAVGSAPTGTITWDVVTDATRYHIYQVINETYQYLGASGTNAFDVPASSVKADPDTAAPEDKNPFNGPSNQPGVGKYHKQRLWRARTNNKPQTLFGSRVADDENMNVSDPVSDDDAATFTLDASVTEIRGMVSINDLLVFTQDAEFKVAAGSQSDGITPSSVNITYQSSWGASDLPPIVVGKSVLFVDGSKQRVRDLLYTLEQDGYDGSDLSILAGHLVEDDLEIVDWTFQRYPDPTLWCVRSDGVLLGMTYHREHKIWAWHQHDTLHGLFESVSSVTTAEGKSETHFIIKRTIDGQTKRYIEKLHTRVFTDIKDAFFVDSGLTYDGSPAITLSGYDHLEGETLSAFADGNVVLNLVVEDGEITLPQAASKVHAGLPIVADLVPTDFDLNTQRGSIQDKYKFIPQVVIRVRKSRDFYVGSDEDNLYPTKTHFGAVDGTPQQPVTMDIPVEIDPNPDPTKASVWIRVTDPVPVTIQAIIAKLDVGES